MLKELKINKNKDIWKISQHTSKEHIIKEEMMKKVWFIFFYKTKNEKNWGGWAKAQFRRECIALNA